MSDTRPTISALTIAKGRHAHLANVIRGFAAQTEPPVEMVVAVMDDAPYTDLPAAPFPVRQVHVTRPDGELPLAAARNAAANAATGDVLAFVDVDCIPHPDFVADIAAVAEPGPGLLMGEVMYLPHDATRDGLDFAAFDRVAQRHSDRQGPPSQGLRACNDYRCFWSLNFAMHRADWHASGGFDERFFGYGGEDTDFGRTLDDREIPIWWMKGARVYHQHHDHFMPPIHQIPAILRNTEVFARKWGHRTMGHWLYGFQVMGLIEERGGELVQIAEPGEAEIALCRQGRDMPYANTRRVLDTLQAREAEGMSNRERTEDVARRQAHMTAAE